MPESEGSGLKLWNLSRCFHSGRVSVSHQQFIFISITIIII